MQLRNNVNGCSIYMEDKQVFIVPIFQLFYRFTNIQDKMFG